MKTKTSTSNTSSKFSPGFTLVLVAAALMAICPAHTRANTVALDFTGGSFGSPSQAPITLGWEFTLNTDVLLTDLGLWDGPNPDDGSGVAGDGLLQSHLVTIWTSAGVQVAQATVDNSGTILDNFRYVTIGAPILLTAGDYVIGAFFESESPDGFIFNAATISPASELAYTGSRSEVLHTFPTGDFFGNSNSYFGPNFKFTEPNGASVPDAGSTFLLMVGSVAALLIVGRLCQGPSKI